MIYFTSHSFECFDCFQIADRFGVWARMKASFSSEVFGEKQAAASSI